MSWLDERRGCLHTAFHGILLHLSEAAMVVLVRCGLTWHNKDDAMYFVSLLGRSDEVGVVRRQILGQFKAAGQMAVQYEAELAACVIMV